jgi:type IX secretion system PorP/SprF family membrane protein
MRPGISKITRYLIIAVISVLSAPAVAQQLPVYSQYMMNKFLLNPAVAGSEGYTAVNLTTRKQWIGVKEAPLTFAASAQTRILKKNYIKKRDKVKKRGQNSSRAGQVGLGGYLFEDRNGLVGRTGMQLTYAYHIPLENGQLSFGLSGTMWQFRIRKEDARLFDPDDELFNSIDNGMFIPDANVGVYYSDERMYAGFSADQLFQSSLKFGGEGFERYKLHRHFYLMGGYNFELTSDIIMVPSVLLKTTQQFAFQMDLSAKAYFYQDYWAGISFRTGSALVLMGGVQVDKFFFGYAMEFTLGNLRSHSYGTHEIIIAMKLGDNARRYKWLNRH